MALTLLSFGVLLAAPLFSQALAPREAAWFFHLRTIDEVVHTLGQPAMVADFGPGLRSWQYRLGTVDHEDFSHQVVFRPSTGELISVTRSFDPEIAVDLLFPAALTRVFHYPDAAHPRFSVRLRRLEGGRVLLAIGTRSTGQVTGQLVWMRESEVRNVYSWIAEQLALDPR